MLGHKQFDWNEANVATLKQLWASGKSASEIMLEMGCGSRSSVIGKVSRLGLCGQPRASLPKGATKPRPKLIEGLPSRPRVTKQGHIIDVFDRETVELPPEKSDAAVSLVDLRSDHCRWPVEVVDAPMMYCGAAAKEDGPYCARHAAIAFVKPQKRYYR